MTEQVSGAVARGSAQGAEPLKTEQVRITDVYYAIPKRKRYAMWRFKLSNGLTVWMQMDYNLVPSIGDMMRCDWLSEKRICLHWPIGRSISLTTFDIGRFCI